MDFSQIDKEEFVVYNNHVKLGKRIVQYAVFDEGDIVVLLVSNTGDWKYRDEIIAIYSKWKWRDYKILWSYQLKDSNNTEKSPIYKIWKVEQDGKECVACLFSSSANMGACVFDIESGNILEQECDISVD